MPLLNKAVLSNIYATERKQGHGRASVDTAIGGGCHMIQARAGTKKRGKKNQALCLQEVLISELPGGIFLLFFFFFPK